MLFYLFFMSMNDFFKGNVLDGKNRFFLVKKSKSVPEKCTPYLFLRVQF